MSRKPAKASRATTRDERLGFRLDEGTKELIERAANLEHRKLTDFCVMALADAARRTVAQHEMLVLSGRDRQAFFAALINPPNRTNGSSGLSPSISGGFSRRCSGRQRSNAQQILLAPG